VNVKELAGVDDVVVTVRVELPGLFGVRDTLVGDTEAVGLFVVNNTTPLKL
jgi:hypothetical protein